MSGVCSIRRCPVGPAGWHDPGEVRTSVDISRVSDKSWPLRVSCCQLLLPTSGRHSPSAPRVALRSGGCGSSVVVCSSGRRAAARPETAPAPPPRLRLRLRGAAWPAARHGARLGRSRGSHVYRRVASAGGGPAESYGPAQTQPAGPESAARPDGDRFCLCRVDTEGRPPETTGPRRNDCTPMAWTQQTAPRRALPPYGPGFGSGTECYLCSKAKGSARVDFG